MAMKIFYWDDVLRDYTSGMMVAVAENVEDARKALVSECDYIPATDLYKEPQVFDLSEARGFVAWGGG